MKRSRTEFFSALFIAHVLLIFALGLTVRLLYWSDARAYSIGADEPDYVLPAQTLVRDGRYVDTYIFPGRTWTRVPLTSLVFAGAFLLVPDEAAKGAAGDNAALMEPRYDALNFAQIGESLLTIALIMLLAWRIFPQRKRPAAVVQRKRPAAVVGGYIAALYPPLASSPAQRALSEPTSILLIVAAIYILSWWSPEASARRSLVVAGGGGALLGLAALARPIGLMFLPFAIVWMFVVYWLWRRQRRGETEDAKGSKSSLLTRFRKPILSATAATVLCFLCIAPWTLYNYRHYGRFLLLDTASATAYWNYHNFRGEDITARMDALSNPADRLSLIVQEGTANIVEYPGQTIGSSIFAFFYFWHLESNSAVLLNPWDMTQRDPDVPDLLHSDAAFLLVGLAGICGLVGVGFRRPIDAAGRTLLLLNLWLLSMLLLGILVPYDGRYRLPAAPCFIVMAAGLLVTADWRAVFAPRKAWALLKRYPRVVAGSAILCLWVVAGAYSPNIPPLLRCLYQSWRGDLALSGGNAQAALGRYQLAQEAFPNFFYGYRREADAARQFGMDDLARQEYALSRNLAPDDPYSILGFADLAARHSEWTLTPAEHKWLLRDESDWRGNPWNSFQPSPTASIDIGTGSDLAYIRGFYTPDAESPTFNYRWSEGRSWVRVPLPAVRQYKSVRLRMSAPAVGPRQPIAVTVTADGTPTTLQVHVGWADYTVPLPAFAQFGSRTLTLEITCPTRKVTDYAPNSTDPRSLGVGIDTITLVP